MPERPSSVAMTPRTSARKGKPSLRSLFAARTPVARPTPKKTVASTKKVAAPPMPITRDCCVAIERIDLAKWKDKIVAEAAPPVDRDTRLRKKENGMVLLPRSFYNQHPARGVATPKRSPKTQSSPSITTSPVQMESKKKASKRRASEINTNNNNSPIKTNNVFNTTTNGITEELERDITYKLIFEPKTEVKPPKEKRIQIDFTLKDLSDNMDATGLPSELWEIERIPPRRQQIDSSYDTIAAELEALMGEKTEIEETPKIEEKSIEPQIQEDTATATAEEFPSIMDILNEAPTNTETPVVENTMEPTNIETHISENTEEKTERPPIEETIQSPPLTEETTQPPTEESIQQPIEETTQEPLPPPIETPVEEVVLAPKLPSPPPPVEIPTQPKPPEEPYEPNNIIFRRMAPDKQSYDRLVTFNVDMEYLVAINDNKVELIGAPAYISSADDLKILLQIVDNVDMHMFNVVSKS